MVSWSQCTVHHDVHSNFLHCELRTHTVAEDSGWSLDMVEMQRSLDAARAKGICVRVLVYINPGNPTGNCLSEQNVRDVLQFCYDNSLVLIADEVYQENIFNPSKPFFAARAVLKSMSSAVANGVELFSLGSVSKGSYGECGLRGGYFEAHNVDPAVIDELYKLASINLSPNIVGQVAVGIMCNPPKPGDYSYARYHEEQREVIASLQRRARRITDAFNALEGVICQDTDGNNVM